MTTHTIYHSTFYQFCKSVEDMHIFYIKGLGLQETYYDADQGWLTCDSGALNLVFIQTENANDIQTEWAKQPTFPQGTAPLSSWTITVDPQLFDEVVARLRDVDLDTHITDLVSHDNGHQHIWLRDPMGTTIELHSVKV